MECGVLFQIYRIIGSNTSIFAFTVTIESSILRYRGRAEHGTRETGFQSG